MPAPVRAPREMKSRGVAVLRCGGRPGAEIGSCWCHEPVLDCDRGELAGTTPCRPLLAEHGYHNLEAGPPCLGDQEGPMDVLYPRAAGLDIHKKVIVACRILPGIGRQ